MKKQAEIAICGAGIAGISTAYHLGVKRGVKDILLIDERSPLSLTSDKSSECYRNWWPGPGNAMVALMNRSINIMEELAEESGNTFHLNRRGYLYLTANVDKVPQMISTARQISDLGAGPLRIHSTSIINSEYQPAQPDDFKNQPDGADLLIGSELILRFFPYLAADVQAALHVRRAGWFSAQQLGVYLLEQASKAGMELLQERVTNVFQQKDKSFLIETANGSIQAKYFVNAAGPLINDVGKMMGVDLPVYCERHIKIGFLDNLKVVARDAPLLIWSDPQNLNWTDEECSYLAEDEDLRWMLGEMPPGVHTRPDGGADSPILLMLWEYHTKPVEPVWPLPTDPAYPDVVLRGLSRMIPGLSVYLNRMPQPSLDGGYYTKTRENRPLIGKMPIDGAYLIGALSGFGMMSACAAGELLAAIISGEQTPPYASDFSLERYSNPGYRSLLENWGETGQL